MNSVTTSATLLTPTGRGAVATIVVEAEPSQLASISPLFSAANGKSVEGQQPQRLVFGHWGESEPFEDLVLCRQSSSTLEIHCHGGKPCIDRILADLKCIGFNARTESAESLQIELTQAVAHAPTLRTAQWMLIQQRLWPRFLESLLKLTSTVELAATVRGVLEWAEFGLHLIEPWQVAIVGPPNVGKSTLLNALLGFDRSIVYDRPGTTRDVVSARTVFDGWPVLVSDSAGIRETDDAIESGGIRAARAKATAADIRLVVTDLSCEQPTAGLNFEGRTLKVGNKADAATVFEHPVDVRTSATELQNIDQLISQICELLVPAEPAETQCVPTNANQVAWLSSVIEICEQGKLDAAKELVRARLS